jgi:uncharacterized protein (DUF2235 family)
MKNVVVCCDGTWNTPDFRVGTNVWKLFLAMPENSKFQVKYYDTGVGTQGLKDKISGGLTGEGLVDNIFEAYRFICSHYTDGDKIFIFGFSRGAYTARALSGVLGDIGVLQFDKGCQSSHFLSHHRTCFDNQMLSENNDKYDLSILCESCKNLLESITRIKQEFKAYKKENYKAAKDHIREHGAFPGNREPLKDRIEKVNDGHWRYVPANIELVGVWDTVSALGIPSLTDLMKAKETWKRRVLNGVSNWLFKSSRKEYAFINNQMNSSVRNGYHALALDEKRDLFKPVLWDAQDNVEQIWFVGAHSNVGGGYLDHSLSDIPLLWMIKKAEEHEIIFDRNCCSATRPNYLGLLNRSSKDGPFRFLPDSYRVLPVNKVIHDSVYGRIKNSIEYKPKNLFKK